MGSFANSLHVKSDDAAAVADAIRSLLLAEGYEATEEELPRNERFGYCGPLRALSVSQAHQGWVSVLDSEMMGSVPLAAALSGRLKTDALYVLVNDSDSWHYQLFRNGQLLDEFASSGDEDGEGEDFEDAAELVEQMRVNTADFQRVLMERALEWQKEVEKRLPPHLRELQEKWKKTGRIPPEEMQQYQQWVRTEMTPLMGDLRSMLGDLSTATRSTRSQRAQPGADDKLLAQVEHLRPLLQTGVTDEQVVGVLGKQEVFAENTLEEFLPLVGIASFYAYLSYAYLGEHTPQELASNSIRLVEHLKFKKSAVPGNGRFRVVG
jgi:hypothetical protein